MSITRYESNGRMSRAVEYGGVLYLCGHVAPPEIVTAKEQTKYIVNRIESVLEKYGSDKNRILTATIYLKDIADFAEMNEVWDAWIDKDSCPARTCVEAVLAGDAFLVEITVTAAIK